MSYPYIFIQFLSTYLYNLDVQLNLMDEDMCMTGLNFLGLLEI